MPGCFRLIVAIASVSFGAGCAGASGSEPPGPLDEGPEVHPVDPAALTQSIGAAAESYEALFVSVMESVSCQLPPEVDCDARELRRVDFFVHRTWSEKFHVGHVYSAFAVASAFSPSVDSEGWLFLERFSTLVVTPCAPATDVLVHAFYKTPPKYAQRDIAPSLAAIDADITAKQPPPSIPKRGVEDALCLPAPPPPNPCQAPDAGPWFDAGFTWEPPEECLSGLR